MLSGGSRLNKKAKNHRNIDGVGNKTSESRYGQKAAFFILVMVTNAFAQDPNVFVKGLIEKTQDTTHVEFQGRNQWDYEVKRSADKKLHLFIPMIDPSTEVQLKSLKNDLVESVEINPSAKDNKTEVVFKLKNSDVESFDYLTDQPSRLIIDFYQQKKSPAAVLVQAPKVLKKKIQPQVEMSGDYKKISRVPAGTEFIEVSKVENNDQDTYSSFQSGAYDGSDPHFKRFLIKDYQIKEESLIASRQNIYVHFPMLKMETSRLSEMVANPPEYEINVKETQESKEAKLILTLFKNDRPALCLKAAGYFLKNYPKSTYEEIVRNVIAEIHYNFFLESGKKEELEAVRVQYQYLVKNFPNSVLTERTDLMLAYMDLDQKSGLDTIQSFSNFIQKYPQSTAIDGAKKALADAYLILNKFDDALNVYSDIRDHSKTPAESVEAQYRMGDVYFSQKNYAKAAELYADVLKRYPAYQSKFPNAFFNMAEAQFWLGKYQPSLTNYVQYLKNFPTGAHGGYAMTRVGEVLEILGADQKQVMGAFLESNFRYHGNPGADVALIRMLAQRMKGMKPKELNRSIEEMDHIAKNAALPDMSQFVTLIKADGYKRRGEYTQAAEDLIHYYQANPITSNLEVFKGRIVSNLAQVISNDVESEQFLKPLQTASHYSNTWLKNHNRLDIPFSLARAYEKAGVLKESEKNYSDILKTLDRIHNTTEEKERKVLENLPHRESVALRLAAVKAEGREYSESQTYLNQIKDEKVLSDAEKVERVELNAEVAEARGDLGRAEQALKALTETYKGQTQFLLPAILKLGEIRLAQKNPEGALKAFDQIAEQKKKSVKISPDVWAKTLRARGDALMEKGEQLAAAETYQQLLDEFEVTKPLGSVRYQMGQIYFKKGDIKNAAQIWSRLEGDKNQMYQKLAQEKLKNAEWQDEYKHYIKRIPAMTEVE